jgi:hypothetical protein
VTHGISTGNFLRRTAGSGQIASLGSEDVSGAYINIVRGFRVTTDVPRDPERRLLLFGTSVVANFQVPDNLTVASQLQRLFNERTSTRWEVSNLGRQGFTVLRQSDLLKTTPLQPNDVVVFYDHTMIEWSLAIAFQTSGIDTMSSDPSENFSDGSSALRRDVTCNQTSQLLGAFRGEMCVIFKISFLPLGSDDFPQYH